MVQHAADGVARDIAWLDELIAVERASQFQESAHPVVTPPPSQPISPGPARKSSNYSQKILFKGSTCSVGHFGILVCCHKTGFYVRQTSLKRHPLKIVLIQLSKFRGCLKSISKMKFSHHFFI